MRYTNLFAGSLFIFLLLSLVGLGAQMLVAAELDVATGEPGTTSVELGILELSPRGEAGGYAMPASGCSDTSHGPVHDDDCAPGSGVDMDALHSSPGNGELFDYQDTIRFTGRMMNRGTVRSPAGSQVDLRLTIALGVADCNTLSSANSNEDLNYRVHNFTNSFDPDQIRSRSVEIDALDIGAGAHCFRYRIGGSSGYTDTNTANDKSTWRSFSIAVPTPTSPTHSCSADGTQLTMNWNAPSGYSAFYFRMEDLSTGTNVNWNENFTATSRTVTVVPGRTYDWWVHTRASDGEWGKKTGEFAVSCTAPPTVNGSCGTANGRTYAHTDTSYGSYTACSSGTASGFAFPAAGQTDAWTCDGSGTGHTDASCSASRSAVPVNGSCGTADGRTYDHTDTSYGSYSQCAAGSPSSTSFPSQGGATSWSCSASGGGSPSGSCTASRAAAPAPSVDIDLVPSRLEEGATSEYILNNKTYTPGQVVSFKSRVSNNDDDASQPYRFEFRILNSARTSAVASTFTDNNAGIGGFGIGPIQTRSLTMPSTAGNYYLQARVLDNNTYTLFSSDTDATPGNDVSEIPISVVAAVNGSCGTANGRTFAYSDNSYTGYPQCAAGSASNTAFPIQGGSASWTCSGSGGGGPSTSCTASRANAPVNGVCGTANGRTFRANDTSYGSYTACSSGTASGFAFPSSAGQTNTWSCDGSGGGASPSCSATRAAYPGSVTNLTPSCNAAGTQATFTWNATPGATGYYIRRYTDPATWGNPPCTGDNSASNVGFCNNDYPNTAVTLNVPTGQSFDFWLHARDSVGSYGPETRIDNIVCAAPAPDLDPDNPTKTGGTNSVGARTHTFQGVMRNRGNASSGSFDYQFEIDYYSNNASSPDIVINPANGASIGPGGSLTVVGSQSLNMPEGTHRVRLVQLPAVANDSDISNNRSGWTSFIVAANANVALSLSDNDLIEGESTSLRWSVQDAVSCTATGDSHGGWSGAQASADRLPPAVHTRTITPTTRGVYTYGITCNAASPGAPDSDSATLTVRGPVCSNPSSLEGDKRIIESGDSVELTFSAGNEGDNCTLSGPGVSPGVYNNMSCGETITVNPTKDATYQLMCDGGASIPPFKIKVLPVIQET